MNTAEEQQNNKPIVIYRRRFAILLSYFLGYFFWNWSETRHVILATSYAKYHDVTNEVSLPTLGIDFINILSSLTVVLTYSFGAWFVDRIGLQSITIGNIGLAISQWIRYAAFNNFPLALFSVGLASFFGPLIGASIIAISNRWFPVNERAKATGFGLFGGLMGNAAALIVGPLFEIGENFVDFSMRSCHIDQISNQTLVNYENATKHSITLSCLDYPDAYINFCCCQLADINQYNLLLAILPTIIALFSILSVRNLPPTPPSLGGEEKPNVSFYKTFTHVLTERRVVQVNIADFFITGPPYVLFATIARILPATVQDLSFIMSAIGIGFAIPSVIVVTMLLDRYKIYWPLTFGAYVFATSLFLFASIGFSTNTYAGGLLVVICGTLAIISFVIWQVSGFELKLEWAFTSEFNVEGGVASFDRIVVNLSSVLFLLAIPPERVSGNVTFWAGFGILLIGVLIAIFIPNKYHYNRVEYEKRNRVHSLAIVN